MKKMNLKKGFTLIELLVVVAIIGILASVVLASLNTARAKGNDAKVKAQLSGIRAAAEIYYSTNSNYGAAATTCSTGMFTDTASGIANLVNANNYPTSTVLDCGSSGTAWSVSGSLAGGATTTGPSWCVDSTGTFKRYTGNYNYCLCWHSCCYYGCPYCCW